MRAFRGLSLLAAAASLAGCYYYAPGPAYGYGPPASYGYAYAPSYGYGPPPGPSYGYAYGPSIGLSFGFGGYGCCYGGGHWHGWH